jgi:uncharacterized membrane protein YfcA
MMPVHPLGLVLGFAVGIVLGLLGGGGSILALPIFVYVFHKPPTPAVAMSLAVVAMGAFIGFLTHWRQGSVALRVAVPFGLLASVTSFLTAMLTHHIPEGLRLPVFAVFAFTAAFFMLRDSLRNSPSDTQGSGDIAHGHMTPLVALEALGVGALTALIGAGGGFVIVPVLVLLAGLPIRAAVGSSLLIITLNGMSGFVGYVIKGIEIDWPLVISFTLVAAAGAVIGTRLNRRMPQKRIKQAFAVLIFVLGTYLVLRNLLGK